MDRTGRIRESHFTELARSGFYGFPGTAGISAQQWLDTASILIAGCLATGFVWAQHVGALRSMTLSDNVGLRETYIAAMAAGDCRCCVTYAGAAATPTLFIEETDTGYVLDGTAPFVSGWDYTHALVASALWRKDRDYIAAVMVADKHDKRVHPSRLQLVAAEASSTVHVHFDRLPVPRDHLVGVTEKQEFLRTRVAANDWVNGALAIGVLEACLQELEHQGADAAAHRAHASRLRAQYAEARADADAVHRLRAEIMISAVNTAAAVVVATGSRATLAHSAAERCMRQAAFALVATTRDPIKQALLDTLAP